MNIQLNIYNKEQDGDFYEVSKNLVWNNFLRNEDLERLTLDFIDEAKKEGFRFKKSKVYRVESIIKIDLKPLNGFSSYETAKVNFLYLENQAGEKTFIW